MGTMFGGRAFADAPCVEPSHQTKQPTNQEPNMKNKHVLFSGNSSLGTDDVEKWPGPEKPWELQCTENLDRKLNVDREPALHCYVYKSQRQNGWNPRDFIFKRTPLPRVLSTLHTNIKMPSTSYPKIRPLNRPPKALPPLLALRSRPPAAPAPAGRRWRGGRRTSAARRPPPTPRGASATRPGGWRTGRAPVVGLGLKEG